MEQIDAVAAQHVQFGYGFDTFGDHRCAEIGANVHEPSHDGLPDGIGFNIAYEVYVELHDIGAHIDQKIEAGVTGAEVIDRRLESARLVMLDDFFQMREIGDFLAY